MQIVDRKVCPVDPPKFSEEFRTAKQVHCEHTIARETSVPAAKRNASRISAATRLAKLWKQVGPVNSVSAVLCRNSSTATSEHNIAIELGQVWANTFSKIEGVPSQAFEFRKKMCSPWDVAFISPPCVGEIVPLVQMVFLSPYFL